MDQENANQPPVDLTATFIEQENANQPADPTANQPADQGNANQPADSNAEPSDQGNANQPADSNAEPADSNATPSDPNAEPSDPNATPTDQENVNQPADSNAVKSDNITNEQELAKSLTNVVDYITDIAAKKVSEKVSAAQLGDKQQNGFDTVNAVAKTMANSGGKKRKSRKFKLTNKNKTRQH
jgi:N-glycosylase/DNA lyase